MIQIPAAIDSWARAAAPGARRYRVHSDGTTLLYSSTFDGEGQMWARYKSSTAASRAIEADNIDWRLDLRRDRQRRERAAVAP